eukprot:Ihof_evm2s449 gene=Ihof_evmTU2s449
MTGNMIVEREPSGIIVEGTKETAAAVVETIKNIRWKKWVFLSATSLYMGFRVIRWTQSLNQETKETWQKVQGIVKTVLGGPEGVGPVEAIVGMSMLQAYYENDRPRGGERVINTAFMKVAVRHMRYAAAAYGWKLVNRVWYSNIESYVNNTLTDRKRDEINIAILEKHTGIVQEDLLLAQWSSGGNAFDPACYIGVDHEHQTIVLVIRGTMNVTDVLTDLDCHEAPFQNGVTHEGFLKSALYKYDQTKDIILDCVRIYPSYVVSIVGHSLGAGTASVLALLYAERHPDLPLHCYAFGPPGVFDIDMANDIKTKSLITSFVYRDDIVCRLSYGHVIDLKQKSRWLISQLDEQSSAPMHILACQLSDVTKKAPALEGIVQNIIQHTPIDITKYKPLQSKKLYVPAD